MCFIRFDLLIVVLPTCLDLPFQNFTPHLKRPTKPTNELCFTVDIMRLSRQVVIQLEKCPCINPQVNYNQTLGGPLKMSDIPS